MSRQVQFENQDIEVLIDQTVEDLALSNDHDKSVAKRESKASTIIKVFLLTISIFTNNFPYD